MAGRVIEELLQSSEPAVMAPGLLTPSPWPRWSARIRSLSVDGTRADWVDIGPHVLEVPPFRDRSDQTPRMMLTVVLSGTTTGEVDGHPVVLGPKEAALIDGRAAMRFHAAEPLRGVRIFVDEDHLPAELLAGRELPFARLKDSPLVAACVGFITGLLQVGNPTVEPHDELAVSQPLIALQVSLLNEALHQTGTARDHDLSGARSRRARIEAYIEEHLADPDLTVATIAAALDVSTRTVHGDFRDGPETVAAQIRRRRVARAQVLLAARREPPNAAALAARVGLSRDQFARTFRAATGTTVRRWWDQHHS